MVMCTYIDIITDVLLGHFYNGQKLAVFFPEIEFHNLT